MFAFPSNRERALSTILLDKMSTLTFTQDPDNFAAAFSLITISLWSQCLEEKYVSNVHPLLLCF